MPGTRRVDRLTPPDLAMLWPEDFGWPEDMAALAVLDGDRLLDDAGRVRIDAVRRRLEPKLDLLPRFRQVLHRPRRGLGGPFWADAPAFDLADHVQIHPVAAPGGEAQLLQAAEELLRRRLDPARPRWEMWFLPGLPHRRVGLFLKLHHAVADGVAGIATLGALLDPSADPPAESARPWSPAPFPTARELFRDNLRRRGHGLRRGLARLARPVDTVRAVLRAPQWREFFGQRPPPRTSLNRPVGAARGLALVRGRLDLAKRIAHGHGATVNDVVLNAVAGGLRDLLRARGEEVAGLVLRVMVPVSQHGSQHQVSGNRDAMMLVSLPVGVADPVRRLRLVAAETAARKKRVHPDTAAGPMSLPVVQRLSTRFLVRQRFVNLAVTNVQGPPVPLHLAGARLRELFPISPLVGNMPVGVAVLSYTGQLNLTAVADPDACPDVSVFAGGVRDTLDALERSVAGDPSPAAP